MGVVSEVGSESTTGKPPKPARWVCQLEPEPEVKPKSYKEYNDLGCRASALAVPRQLLYGTSTTGLRTLLQSLSQTIDSAGRSQAMGNRSIPMKPRPSAPQQDLIDLTNTQTKNLHPWAGQ